MTGPQPWLAILGPTGSGKSALALAIAAALDGEIVSCDSVQLYRGFDLGAAKPTAAERQAVAHHLIDCLDWHQDFDAAQYALLARQTLADVWTRRRLPIVVGGTGLYFRALVAEAFHDAMPKDETLRAQLKQQSTPALYEQLLELDPRRAAQLHPHDRFRVVRAVELCRLLGRPVSDVLQAPGTDDTPLRRHCHLLILDPPRMRLHAAIAQRTHNMLQQGLVSEVQGLLQRGVDPLCKPMQSIGYKQVVAVLQAGQDVGGVAGAVEAATRQYAKRQSTWFRKVRADSRLTDWEATDVIVQLQQALSHNRDLRD